MDRSARSFVGMPPPPPLSRRSPRSISPHERRRSNYYRALLVDPRNSVRPMGGPGRSQLPRRRYRRRRTSGRSPRRRPPENSGAGVRGRDRRRGGRSRPKAPPSKEDGGNNRWCRGLSVPPKLAMSGKRGGRGDEGRNPMRR